MRNVFVACAVAISSAALAAAQQSGANGSAANAEPVTVSGCLVQSSAANTASTGSPASTGATASTTTAGTSGSAAATTAGGAAGTSGTTASSSFMLTKATPAQTGPAGTLSSNLPAQAAARASTYRLDGHEAELKTHLNHVVEVRGQLEQTTTSTTAVPDAKSSATNGHSADNQATMRLKVDSVRELFSKCD